MATTATTIHQVYANAAAGGVLVRFSIEGETDRGLPVRHIMPIERFKLEHPDLADAADALAAEN